MTDIENTAFDCSYIGFVPLGSKYSKPEEIEDLEGFLETSIRTLLNGTKCSMFAKLLEGNVVKPFVRLNDIKCSLEISCQDLKLSIEENILGKYSINSISFACPFVMKNTNYIGIFTSCNELSELQVIMLNTRETVENIMNTLEFCRNAPGTSQLPDDLKSVQTHTFDTRMTPFFHDCLSEKQWTYLLRNPGDFLFRSSRQSSIKNIVLSYRDKNEELLHFICKDDPFLVLLNFQVMESSLKNPVIRTKHF